MENTSTEDLSIIIVKAIEDEPFLNKETLIPKIKSLIKAFRLTLDISNYNKSVSKNKKQNLYHQIRLKDAETNFWKHRVQNIVGKVNMQEYYDELDLLRKQFNNEQS